nr:hypothetical protein [uncultured Pseudomonas sp.]
MMESVIAQLTGKVKFDVDTSGLVKFQNLMKQLDAQLKPMLANINKMEKSLNKLAGINPDGLKNAAASRSRALDRELRAEQVLRDQQQKTFQAELSAQKLQYKGMEQASALRDVQYQRARQQQQMLQKMEIQAQARRGRPANKEKQAIDQRLRLARLEAIHAKTKERSRLAEAQYQNKMNQFQRGQYRLEVMREDAKVKAARNTQRSTDALLARQRATAREERQVERHEWARQRHVLRQQAGSSSALPSMLNAGLNGIRGGVGAGLGAAMAAAAGPLGLLAAAAGAAAVGISTMNDRLEQRKQGVINAESFDQAFVSLSQNPAIQKQAKQAFIDIQTRNAGVIDADTAKQFGGFATTMLKMGKTPQQILAEWEKRSKAFRIGGLNADAQRDMNREFTRLQTSGKADAADVEQITDRLPGLTPYLAKAAAQGTKFAQSSMEVMIGQWNKNLKAGKGLSADVFNRAMESFLKDNEAAYQKSLKSVGAQQQLLENQRYLQQQNINTTEEVTQAIRDRIAAEAELADKMQPVNEAMAEFDVQLVKVYTSLASFTGWLLGAQDKAKGPSVPVVDKEGKAVLDKDGKPVTEVRERVGFQKAKDDLLSNSDDSALERGAKRLMYEVAKLMPFSGAALAATDAITERLGNQPMTMDEQRALIQARAQAEVQRQVTAAQLNSAVTSANPAVAETSTATSPLGVPDLAPVQVHLELNTTVNAATSDPKGLANQLVPELAGPMRDQVRQAISETIANARSQQKETRR